MVCEIAKICEGGKSGADLFFWILKGSGMD